VEGALDSAEGLVSPRKITSNQTKQTITHRLRNHDKTDTLGV